MRFCRMHRALESAEEGICEVGARILLVPGPYPKPDYPDACQLVDALVIEKDNEGIERLAKAWHEVQEQHRASPTYWEEQSADYRMDRRTKALNLFEAVGSMGGE